MPLVSVYIATSNRPALLDRAVQSVLCQDFRDFELIIVDDSSDERVQDIWDDRRVSIISNTRNLGAPVSRNIAIRAAKGMFITGLDDDDVFLPSRLSSFLKAWRELQPVLSVVPVAGLFDSCLVLTSSGSSPDLRFRDSISKLSDLSRRNNIGSQVFAPASHFHAVGGFDPEMPAWQDWELWHRLARAYGCFLNIHSTSMVVDESHGQGRITTSRDHTIRSAERLFVNKAGIESLQVRAEIRLASLAYPSVQPCIADVLLMLRAKRYRQALRLARLI